MSPNQGSKLVPANPQRSSLKIGEDKLQGHLAFGKKVSLEMFFGPNNTTVAEFCKFQEDESMKTERLYMRHVWGSSVALHLC